VPQNELKNGVLPANGTLRKIRVEEKGWTMEELARRAEVSAQTVRKAERGLSVSEISQARIAKTLGVSVERLFSDGQEVKD
jgi:transcriptional regulator with XRE-family HTH domain